MQESVNGTQGVRMTDAIGLYFKLVEPMPI
jgi:hypothetical protein